MNRTADLQRQRQRRTSSPPPDRGEHDDLPEMDRRMRVLLGVFVVYTTAAGAILLWLVG